MPFLKVAKIIGWIYVVFTVLSALFFLIGLLVNSYAVQPLGVVLSLVGIIFTAITAYGILKLERWIAKWLIFVIFLNTAVQIINVFTTPALSTAGKEAAEAAQELAPGLVGTLLHLGPAIIFFVIGWIIINIIPFLLLVYFSRHKKDLST